MHQDLREVLFIQDEEVSEAVRYHISCAPIPSTYSQQADREMHLICYTQKYCSEMMVIHHTVKLPEHSPDFPENRSGPQSDKHSFTIRASNHLHLSSFDDIHLPADLTLTQRENIHISYIRG